MNYSICYNLIMSILCLIIIRKHILMCLMTFEFIVVNLLLIIMNYCQMFNYSMYLFIMMMTFYVCEGVIGLSIMVQLMRCHGNDYMNSLLMW